MENYADFNKDETFDAKEFIFKVQSYWYYFAISLFLALLVAKIINLVTTPVYEVKSSVLIHSEQPVIDAKFSFGSNLYNNTNQILNEIGILQSYTLAQRAINNLDFTVSYFLYDNFIKKELYKNTPFLFQMDSSIAQPILTEIEIKVISATQVKIIAEKKDAAFYNFYLNQKTNTKPKFNINQTVSINTPFRYDGLAGTVTTNLGTDLHNYIGDKFYIILYDPISLIDKYRDYKATDNKNSSIINISITGQNPKKLADFLNSLTQEYLKKGLEKKNQIADNTIRFINTQLGDVTDSLYFSEKVLQDYRKSSSIMNIDMQSQQAISMLDNLQNQKAEIIVRKKYYDYLKKYLSENKDGQDFVAPTSLGIDDASLTTLTNELINQYTERLEIVQNLKRDNPMVSAIDNKIANSKKIIQDNLSSLLHAANISIQDIDQRIEDLNKKVNQMPETERRLFGFERQFKLNDALYTFLLTKRSEVQISKASYLPENEILDIARTSEAVRISPKTNKNYLIAFILGLGLPIVIILITDYFNDKIKVNKDIEKVTSYPTFGYVIHNKEKCHTVVADMPLSLPAESFRAIRTNFQFIPGDKGKNTMIITSSMMGEGKSFISLNLALSFALNNKRVILLNFDLRKPKMEKYLDLSADKGLSLYLSGNASIDDIIIKTKYENFDVIVSGATPPNPMELISGNRTSELIETLQNQYDFVIIDSPPIGMVADALILFKYVNTILYVARQGKTLRHVFTEQMQSLERKKINNVNIILNDVQIGNKYRNYSYGYAYTYGYGYSYGEKKRKKKNENS
jgi:tyrosine-protein kinase Etk/Wzc